MIPTFADLKSLIWHYRGFPEEFNDGDTAYCQEEKKVYRLIEGIWSEDTQHDPTFQMNLYDVNKQIIGQMPALDCQRAKELLKEKIIEFDRDLESDYYMLLCRDLNYYTVFAHSENPECSDLYFAFEACLNMFEKIYAVDYYEDERVVEIWFSPKDDEEIYCAFIFDFSMGVVTFGG